jgi:hypothetical protein
MDHDEGKISIEMCDRCNAALKGVLYSIVEHREKDMKKAVANLKERDERIFFHTVVCGITIVFLFFAFSLLHMTADS